MANGTFYNDGSGWKPTHSRPPLRRPDGASNSGGGGPAYVVSDTPPEDTSVLWIYESRTGGNGFGNGLTPSAYNGNILAGKKLVTCGDSFTANGYNVSDGFDESVYIYQSGRFAGKNIVYPYIIGLRNDMEIVNLAEDGMTMAASAKSFMDVYRNIPADADYITIQLGINDRVQGLAVGTLEDSTEATFCGAYNIAMEHILVNHPTAHIGIIVSNNTNAEIMEATRGIAERWGVPYLDYGSPQIPLMHRYTGRNVCARAQEIRDQQFRVSATNGHPNTAAHEYESTFIEAWLRTL